jgi:hypothetical protein
MRCWFSKVLACGVAGSLGVVALSSPIRLSAEEPGELLKEATDLKEVASQQIRREVDVQLAAARETLGGNPRAAIDALKLLDDFVRRATEFSAEERAALRERIASVLRQASRIEIKQTAEDQERLANHAAAQEQQKALATIESRQMKLDQLTKRFMALVDEDRLAIAEETAAAATAQADPDSPLNASLPLNARANRYVREAQATRVERQRRVVDALQQTEVAHIPQSDEPPIVYQDAATWQELSRRRSGYSTDMYREKPAEAKIRKALEEQTECDFTEMPLGEVVGYLKDRHDIEIQLDTKSLEDMGASSETPITLHLKGVTLRSALRHILRQLDLTYTIQDEVLFVTTPDVAATLVVPHVYYVADLVLPIKSFPGSMGGFVGGGDNGSPGGLPFGQGQNGGSPFGNNQNGGNQNGNPFGQNGQNMF